jgi:TRAP-type C4-dicarboxylate transport system permease small subunit
MQPSNESPHPIRRLNQGGAVLAGAALFFMMAAGAADAAGAKLFGRPLHGAFELTETLMVLVAFLPLAANQQRRGHISVELLVQRFGPGMKRVSDGLSHVMSFCFYALLARQGWVFAIDSVQRLEYRSGLIAFPVYPAKCAMAAGLSLMALQCLVDVASLFRRSRDGKETASASTLDYSTGDESWHPSRWD